MPSKSDARDTCWPDEGSDKEPGYDAWFLEKVGRTLAAVKTGATTTAPHDEVMRRTWDRLQKKARQGQYPESQ
jgi:hypothetical protein